MRLLHTESIVSSSLTVATNCGGGREVMQESAKLFYAGASPVRHSSLCDRCQVVKTPGCDPGIRWFESNRSPHI